MAVAEADGSMGARLTDGEAEELGSAPLPKRFKISELPLGTEKRSAVDGLVHKIKKGGIYDSLRRQIWAQFNESQPRLAFVDSINQIADNEIERDPSFLSQQRSKAASLLQGVVDRSEIYKQVEDSLGVLISQKVESIEGSTRELRRAEVGDDAAGEEVRSGQKTEQEYAEEAARRQEERTKIREQEEAKRRREEQKEALRMEEARKMKELERLREAEERRKEREARKAGLLEKQASRQKSENGKEPGYSSRDRRVDGDSVPDKPKDGMSTTPKISTEADLEQAALSLLLREGAELAAKNRKDQDMEESPRPISVSAQKMSSNDCLYHLGKADHSGPRLSYSSTLQGAALPLTKSSVSSRERRDDSKSPVRRASSLRTRSRSRPYDPSRGSRDRQTSTTQEQEEFKTLQHHDDDQRYLDDPPTRRPSSRQLSRELGDKRTRDFIDSDPKFGHDRILHYARRERQDIDRESERDDRSRKLGTLYPSDSKSSKSREYFDEHTGRPRARIDDPPDNIDRYVPGKGTVTSSSREKDIEREERQYRSRDHERDRHRRGRDAEEDDFESRRSRRMDREQEFDTDEDQGRGRYRARDDSTRRERPREKDRDSSAYHERNRSRRRNRSVDEDRERRRNASRYADRDRRGERSRDRRSNHDRRHRDSESHRASYRDDDRDRRRDRSCSRPRKGSRERDRRRDDRNREHERRGRDQDSAPRPYRDRDRDLDRRR